MRSPVADLLADLSAAFDEVGVAWYVFGAQAAILYGAARLTADVDVTARLSDEVTIESLTATVERHAFRPRIADAGFIERTRVVPFLHAPTTLPLDVVLAGPGLEEQFFDRAVVRDIEGVRVPVASSEDVVVMKVLAGRPKDFEDVAAIVEAGVGRLDIGYVRRTLDAVQQALAQNDLVPAFEDIVRRVDRTAG